MLDIAEDLNRWFEEGRDFAVATVVAVSGSAPRGPGAALAVDGDGTVIGSVSGGCVEGAVYDLCVRALQDGRTARERFGYDDEDAFAVGLTCGGVIEVLVTPVRADAPVFRAGVSAADRGVPAALARVARGPVELLVRALLVRPGGSYEGCLDGHPGLDRTAAEEARAMLDTGRTGTVEISEDGSRCPGGVTLFVESRVPAPRMIVFGAVDCATALVRAGKFLGFHVTVCDARPVFVTPVRFPEADELVVDWPHRYLRRTATDERTVLCVLTHDAKFDVPLLEDGAASAGRVRRRDGLAQHPRGPQSPPSRSRRQQPRVGPPALPDRPGPRRPDPRGDRPVHRGGDRRGAPGRHGCATDRIGYSHPPRRGREQGGRGPLLYGGVIRRGRASGR
ncbi:hypothetical protein GCM10015535_32620 [Streptomyces gelaticus]|uniref:XdhC/CoxI family protein n=1 Tax=Streptomyces gelaticus TaxID=285446 RepID=A0ABQ2VYU9_9ACTN|nr:hypothetical protein GCM10015535_32620 [Streptomyces gelaticus]